MQARHAEAIQLPIEIEIQARFYKRLPEELVLYFTLSATNFD